MRSLFLVLLPVAAAMAAAPPHASKVDVASIIAKSVEANDRDFKLASDFNFTQREKQGGVVKTSRVTMIDGSPYTRLLSVNGKPLDAKENAAEEQKLKEATQERNSESAAAREERIAKYEKDRKRDHEMMSQLTQAFNFSLIGTGRMRGFKVWMLKAVPRPGYQPPNMDCQVLPGMQGEMWIDQSTYEWVKVMARVIRPVSIEGILAQVQPGTRFEIEKNPVDGGVWQITHYSSNADAHVLFMFNHQEQDDVTYFDFQRIKQ